MSVHDRPLALSVLDRANTRVGASSSDVLRGVVDRAKHLEALGYRRVWAAEHHGVPGIAGSTPTLLMTAIAAATTRIRVGSGGIMLPAHQPLVVGEQIATLEALFPGRIDVGLGRSVGFTPAVREALRQSDDAASCFPDDLAELQLYLTGEASITMQPPNAAATPLYVLAHGASLDFAARAGLGVVVGGPSLVQLGPGDVHEGLARYRREFVPSAWFSDPAVIVSASVAIAETVEAARQLLLPEAWSLAHSRTSGSFDPLLPAAEIDLDRARPRERERVETNLGQALAGPLRDVAPRIRTLLDATGADELLVTGGMSDLEGRARSDEQLAELIA